MGYSWNSAVYYFLICIIFLAGTFFSRLGWEKLIKSSSISSKVWFDCFWKVKWIGLRNCSVFEQWFFYLLSCTRILTVLFFCKFLCMFCTTIYLTWEPFEVEGSQVSNGCEFKPWLTSLHSGRFLTSAFVCNRGRNLIWLLSWMLTLPVLSMTWSLGLSLCSREKSEICCIMEPSFLKSKDVS
jgi:hypothetical protein